MGGRWCSLSLLGESFTALEMEEKSGQRRGQHFRRSILLRFVGWVPPCLRPSSAFLSLGSRVGRSRLLTPPRVALTPGPRLCRTPSTMQRAQLWIGTSFAIAHMNAMSSRAIAVTATFDSLPRETRRRKRAHKRTCAFQPIAWAGLGRS